MTALLVSIYTRLNRWRIERKLMRRYRRAKNRTNT